MPRLEQLKTPAGSQNATCSGTPGWKKLVAKITHLTIYIINQAHLWPKIPAIFFSKWSYLWFMIAAFKTISIFLHQNHWLKGFLFTIYFTIYNRWLIGLPDGFTQWQHQKPDRWTPWTEVETLYHGYIIPGYRQPLWVMWMSKQTTMNHHKSIYIYT